MKYASVVKSAAAWIWATPDRRAFARSVLGAVAGAVATQNYYGALVGVANLAYEYLTGGNPDVGVRKK